MRTMWYEPNATSVNALRARLLGSGPTRGFSGKFRAACRSGLHYWRGHFAKLHFQRAAFWRYNYPFGYHAEARSSAKGYARTINGNVLTPRYSAKMVKQAQLGLPVSNYEQELPLVLTGNTRRDILGGPFRTYGAGTRIIRGSWGGSKICWAQLARVRLHGGLTTVIPQEKDQMLKHIENMFHVFMQEGGNLDYRDEQLLRATGATTLQGAATGP